MRVFRISLVAALSILAFAAAGCVGVAPPDSTTPAATGKPDTPAATDDLAMAAPPDMAGPVWDLAPPKQQMDFASSDLAGFTNCFGAAVCDPTTSFCIKYHSGNQAMPGLVTSGPACYMPDDCNGTTMNCTCIMQDAVLGGNCKSCVDHQDGTYECYATL